MESVRDGAKTSHRTLLRLGEVTALRSTGQLERVVAALETHLRRERVDPASLEADHARAVGGVACAWATWQRLGLDGWFAKMGAGRGAERLADAVFAMAANRLVAPCSKRRLPEWAEHDVAMPDGWQQPSLAQHYRALDAVAGNAELAEDFLFGRLCDLTDLDLRFVCCDLTSTYLEGSVSPSERFASKAFGYSRDRRSDRPQVVIGLLCTGDGMPIAHRVFPGNANDASTLPGVLEGLQERFGVGRICVVADRGLISTGNVDAVADAGFDHILATRPRRDAACREALETLHADTQWAELADQRCRAAEATPADGTRAAIVESDARARRDARRTAELVARAEAGLLALEDAFESGSITSAGLGRTSGRYFLFHCGMGLDAAIVEQVERHPTLKRYLGHPLFLLAGIDTLLRRYDRRTGTLSVRTTAPASATIDGCFVVVAANTDPYTFLGSRPVRIAPAATLHTGLSVIGLRSLRFADSLDVISAVFRANGSLSDTDPSVVQRIDDVRDVTVTGMRPFGHQLDGDHLGAVNELHLEWVPNALQLAIPAASH